ncbi:MarP family serine protease [Granulicoccus phenolivorans]|uniref:MarP family serine protease n=1 Tax=Granulicoccus phenolivorans TaxID=266854 RepID=UPI000479CE48|nr:MarP family serine protease [Granulicoccus phenolivorans]
MLVASVILDIVLAAFLIAEIIGGYRKGLVTTALGLLGVVAGVALSLAAAPWLLGFVPALARDALWRSVIILFVVLFLALLGQSLGQTVGNRLSLRWTRVIGAVNRLLGAVLSGVVSAVIIGLIGLSVLPVLPITWRDTVNQSRLVSTLMRAVPEPVVNGAAEVTKGLYDMGFPRVFGDPSTEPTLPRQQPADDVTGTAGVRQAAASITKIEAVMTSCNRASTGSGWVVSPERVVTNAHVVAGASRVSLQIGGTGRSYPAEVVAFDPELDLAILDVPGLRAAALERDSTLATGQNAVVAGFPRGGPYHTEPVRAAGEVNALGRDIHDQNAVARHIYVLHGVVQPGNSGGPLLTAEGRVAGTVFAKSLADDQTGFALTDGATESLLRQAPSLSSPVSTGTCAA